MPLSRASFAPLLLLTLLQAACADHAPERTDDSASPSAVAEPPSGQRAGNDQGPIASTLSGPARVAVGELAELKLTIDRRALHDRVPVEVRLVLPDEIALERGAVRTTISPSTELSAELRFAVRPLARARQPLRVVIDARGEGFGYHAELPYDFEGRVQPQLLAPARTEAAVRVGRRNFGPSVRVQERPE